MNSGVSRAAIPLKFAISLNAPFSVPSAEAVVADDVVDNRVVEDSEVIDRIDQPADVMIGVLQEAGVHLHLPGQHRLELIGHVLPRRKFGVPGGQLGVRRDDSQLLLPANVRSRCTSHPSSTAPVLVGPLLGDVMRGVRRAWCEIDKKRLVGHQRLLLTHPIHSPIG
jgi:hypothetical protein